jgi:predicted DNA-binding transcriptional regulator
MIDLITVVFEDELATLKTQAQSIAVYGRNIDTIFVVINENSDLGSRINRSWWGKWQERVQIVNRAAFGESWSDNGWLTQQVLKLMVATISSNKWSMILDTKTFFVQPILEFDDCPAVGQLDIYPIFEPSRQIVNQLFEIELTKQLGPGGVPFIINTTEVQRMVRWIEEHTKQNFVEWFQNQGMLTEFILYSGWIQYQYGAFTPLYNISKFKLQPCNLCHSEVDSFDRKFSQMQSADAVSVHRRAWIQLTPTQQQQYTKFLASRGIE